MSEGVFNLSLHKSGPALLAACFFEVASYVPNPCVLMGFFWCN
jgi:hypothetical protein